MKDMVMIQNGRIRYSGSVANKLHIHGFNSNALRPFIGDDGLPYITKKVMTNGKLEAVAVPTVNATLRKDEWEHYDTAVIEAALSRLIGVADLESRGLVFNIANGLGKTVLSYEDQSDISAAEMSMDGATRSKGDRPEWDINYLPLPITHKDFQISARELEASRTTGDALDTTMAALAGRKVAELIESTLFLGNAAHAFGGGVIQGYTNFTHRNAYTKNGNWNDDSAVTGSNILQDVIGMKQASISDRFFGPWVMYIPTNFEGRLDDDFKANSDKSIRTRLLEIDKLQDIKVADSLTTDVVVMVQMTQDVVRLVKGMGITTVQWDTEGGMIHHFKVMAIIVPQLRADQNDRTGIVHAAAS